MNQRRMPNVVLEVEAIGSPSINRDPNARTVHLFKTRDRRPRWHQIRRGNLAIGGRERDLLGPLRLGANVADIPTVIGGRVCHMPRRGILDERRRNPEAPRHFMPHIWRDARWRPRTVTPGHQQEVRHVETNAQSVRRCQLRDGLRRRRWRLNHIARIVRWHTHSPKKTAPAPVMRHPRRLSRRLHLEPTTRNPTSMR